MSKPQNQPKINIKTGDNFSGQLAVGKDIAQIRLTLVLPNGTRQDGVARLYVQGARPVTNPERIFGRREEIARLNDELQSDKNSVFAITGLRGIGKSTLASQYVHHLEQNGSPYHVIYWRQVPRDASDFSLITVVESFFQLLGRPYQELSRYYPSDLVALLVGELRRKPYLLVLDNFETLLDAICERRVTQSDFAELLIKARDGQIGSSRLLLTSWERPTMPGGLSIPFYQIGGLDTDAGVQLLRCEGIDETDEALLPQAVEQAQGHPMALILLAQLVDRQLGQTLARILERHSLWDGEIERNLLREVYEKRLMKAERKLLCVAAAFREEIPLGTLAAAAELTESKAEHLATNLIQKSLLSAIGSGRYKMHSLVQHFAYGELSDKVMVHRRAYQSFLNQPCPREQWRGLDDIQLLIEAHYHACIAGDYDDAYRVLFDNCLDDTLAKWGHARLLVELCDRLLPEGWTKGEQWLTRPEYHSRVLRTSGNAYRHLGGASQAMKYYQPALQISQKAGDKDGEANALCGMGLAYRNLKKYKEAIQCHQHALALRQEIVDSQGERAELLALGIAYADWGKRNKAIEYLQQVLEMAMQAGDRSLEATSLGDIGSNLRHLGRVDEGIKYLKKALKIRREIGDRRGEHIDLGRLGRAYKALGKIEQAISYYQKALKMSKETDDRRGVGINLERLGDAYKTQQKYDYALACFEYAVTVYRAIEDTTYKEIEKRFQEIVEALSEEEVANLRQKVSQNLTHYLHKATGIEDW